MTNEDAIKIIKNEIKCISSNCNRYCETCPLAMESIESIIEALNMAVQLFNNEITKNNNSVNNFSSINLESLFPNNLTDAEQKNIIKNISSNDIDNFFNYLNKRMKDSLSYSWIEINGEDKNKKKLIHYT